MTNQKVTESSKQKQKTLLDLIIGAPGRVRVRRAAGWGPAYIPESKVTIAEGEEYWLPAEEAEARPDWEVVDS